MKIVLSHPTSNTFVRALAKSMLDAGLLQTYITSIASFPGSTLDRIGHINGLAELKRRELDISLRPYTKIFPFWEFGRIVSGRLKLKPFLTAETGIFSVDKCFKAFDKYVAYNLGKAVNSNVTGVYAYEDTAINSFNKAKSLGIKCIYDLPIAYWETGRRLMAEEAERLPEWSKTLGGGINDSEKKLNNKVLELEQADLVVVPSQFVRDSIPEWAAQKKIIVVPFGTPATSEDLFSNEKFNRILNRPLRVLFAGSMGQRKGLADLFSAIKLLKGLNIELVVMGSLQAPMEFYRNQLQNFTYEPGRPHAAVLELMRSCDIFCLPSIVEGRALVMQEAMSQGLPLIITANTGGQDLIIEGKTGFLVPIRSPQAIAEKINWFLNNRDKLPEMSKNAFEHAQNYSWFNYGNQIIESINTIFD